LLVGLDDAERGNKIAAMEAGNKCWLLLNDTVAHGYKTVWPVAAIYARCDQYGLFIQRLDILTRNPNVAVRYGARSMLFDYFISKNQLEEAEKFVAENVKEHSIYASNAQSMLGLGMIKTLQKKLDAAEAYYVEVAENHNEPDAYVGLARCALLRGDSAKAISFAKIAYDQLRKSGRVFAPAEYIRAAALFCQHHDQQANDILVSLTTAPNLAVENIHLLKLDQRLGLAAQRNHKVTLNDIVVE
jgi:tetratricopeptide (TPR) repeat protein